VGATRLFGITLLLVLWYFLAGLVFSRVLQVWPDGFEREGFFLSGAALPWSLLVLDFYQATDSPVGAVVRDALSLVVIAAGIAVNAVIGNYLLGAIWRQMRRSQALRRSRPTSRQRR
jgi:hypothetical protein